MGRYVPIRKPIVIWSPQDCKDLQARLNLVLDEADRRREVDEQTIIETGLEAEQYIADVLGRE